MKGIVNFVIRVATKAIAAVWRFFFGRKAKAPVKARALYLLPPAKTTKSQSTGFGFLLDMSMAQLRQICRAEGIPFRGNDSKKTVRSKIRKAWRVAAA